MSNNGTMVGTYQSLVADPYEVWKEKQGEDKLKRSGKNGEETSYDEIENRAMYNAYLKEIDAQNRYNKTVYDAEANKKTALLQNEADMHKALTESSAMAMRAQDYLNRRAKLNGTYASGVSQGSMVELLNREARERADITDRYGESENGIVSAYRALLSDAQGDYDSSVADANTKANETSAQVAIQRAAAEDTWREKMKEAQSELLSVASTYETVAELESAVNAFATLYGEENLDQRVKDTLEKAKGGEKSSAVKELLKEAARGERVELLTNKLVEFEEGVITGSELAKLFVEYMPYLDKERDLLLIEEIEKALNVIN